jgi:hypothetical protein
MMGIPSFCVAIISGDTAFSLTNTASAASRFCRRALRTWAQLETVLAGLVKPLTAATGLIAIALLLGFRTAVAGLAKLVLEDRMGR